MLVSNAGKGDYRLWWGLDGQVYSQLIPFDVTNPSQLVAVEGTDYAYESSGTHETPWFDAQQSDVDKLALKFKVEVQDASSEETVVEEDGWTVKTVDSSKSAHFEHTIGITEEGTRVFTENLF